MSNSLWPHGLQHTRLPWQPPIPGACSNSCHWVWWCHPNISSSVIPFFSCLQSCPVSGSFSVSQFFESGGQSIGLSVSAYSFIHSLIPMNIQDWFRLGLTDLISLQSKGLSRVFSSTKFKSTNSSALTFLYGPIHTSKHEYWKNHSFHYKDLSLQSNVFAFEYAV